MSNQKRDRVGSKELDQVKEQEKKTKSEPACVVCMEKKELFALACGHEFCRTCIQYHIEAEINGKAAAIKVFCLAPRSSCGKELGFEEIRKFAARAVFERFDMLLLRKELARDPHFIWCSNVRCGSGQVHDGGQGEGPHMEVPIMTCGGCRQKMCAYHQVAWHNGVTCDMFDADAANDGRRATQVYLARNTKPCPSCKTDIEKRDGCDHMTCSCGFEFCWLCLAPFVPIRDEGNHRHQPTCTYFAEYNSSDDE